MKTSKRGMNMRDMKAEQMGKRPRGRPPKHASPTAPAPTAEDARGLEEEREQIDELDEALHVAQADGRFAPTTRFVHDEDDGKNCPDEAPPGWCGDD